jgi:hypothetical protein
MTDGLTARVFEVVGIAHIGVLNEELRRSASVFADIRHGGADSPTWRGKERLERVEDWVREIVGRQLIEKRKEE